MWLLNRLREPSTYAGVPLIAYGVGEMFGAGPEVSQVVQVAGEALPQFLTGNWVGGGAALVFGLVSVLMGEKGQPPRDIRPPRTRGYKDGYYG